jgi:hypothetical protein
MHYVIQEKDYMAGILKRYVGFIYTYVQNLPQKLFSSLIKFLRNNNIADDEYHSGNWNYCRSMHKYFPVATINKNDQRKKGWRYILFYAWYFIDRYRSMDLVRVT